MTIFRKLILAFCTLFTAAFATPTYAANSTYHNGGSVHRLMERIHPGLSKKIKVEITPDTLDVFEITQQGGYPVIRANSDLSAAVGLNWYLKYVAGIHLCWGNMHPDIPAKLPRVPSPIRKSTSLPMRYYLNYCTHSYSMGFWDWNRWEEEIDWMALHGINMPLAITGTDVAWRNVLRRLGYPEEKIDSFIAGPGFQAWWLMNNLEGWGGPNPAVFYDRQEVLARKIVQRMREYGMHPVLPGYSGMVPHDARELLGLDVANSGRWCSYNRPAFLQPTDKDFQRIAATYYDELTRLLGKSRYYSMDPFHEGGSSRGVDLEKAGSEIMKAMKQANPDAVWVIQGWQENPRPAMVQNLANGDLVALDLHAEATPKWSSPTKNFGKHEWLYCMLHNFGGNIGLYGRIPAICTEFAKAQSSSSTLRGIGLTMEGIENNPVVYELMTELPWRGDTDPETWLEQYATARYGCSDPKVNQAWQLLLKSVYNCPVGNHQQGTRESLFCARPSDNPKQASAWANTSDYYDARDVYEAARLMVEASLQPQSASSSRRQTRSASASRRQTRSASASRRQTQLIANQNFLYDLIDITRQAIAEKGREVVGRLSTSSSRKDYAATAASFLRLIELQDSLLSLHPDFRLDTHIAVARKAAANNEEADRYEWNLRTQITVWGNRAASEEGSLNDYSHREWSGLLRSFYLPRWQKWFDTRLATWPDPAPASSIDYLTLEEPWTRLTTPIANSAATRTSPTVHSATTPLSPSKKATIIRTILTEALSQ